MKKVCILKRNENGVYENRMYKKAIKEFGMDPIFINESNLNLLKECSGILLTGGENKIDLDDYLIEYSIKNNIPLFGICLGMQALGTYKTDYNLRSVDNHYKNEKYVHNVKLQQSLLKNIVGNNTIKVNSHHHEVLINSVFDVVGISDDGFIEAIENKNHPFQIGVQWHPERMINYDEASRKIFEYFKEKVNRYN